MTIDWMPTVTQILGGSLLAPGWYEPPAPQRDDHGPKKLHPDELSKSQIEAWSRCRRYWGFRYIHKLPAPQNRYAAEGVVLHLMAEEWLRHGKLPAVNSLAPASPESRAAIALEAMIPLMPRPGHPGLEKESEFHFTVDGPGFTGADGIGYMGAQDVAAPDTAGFAPEWFGASLSGGTLTGLPLIGDWKSTSDLKWALTPEELQDDVQFTIYGSSALIKYPQAQAVAGNWVYGVRGKRQAKFVRVVVPREHIQRNMVGVHATGKEIVHLRVWAHDVRNGFDANNLQPDTNACYSFGQPCPYRAYCKLTPEDGLRGIDLGRTDDTMTMNGTPGQSPAPFVGVDALTALLGGTLVGAPAPATMPATVPATPYAQSPAQYPDLYPPQAPALQPPAAAPWIGAGAAINPPPALAQVSGPVAVQAAPAAPPQTPQAPGGGSAGAPPGDGGRPPAVRTVRMELQGAIYPEVPFEQLQAMISQGAKILPPEGEAPAPPEGRKPGRPKGAQNKPKVQSVRVPPGVPLSSVQVEPAPGIQTVVTYATPAPQTGYAYTLCIDCRPVKGVADARDVMLLSDLLGPVLARVSADYQVPHYAMIKYGEGRGAVASCLAAMLPELLRGRETVTIVADSGTTEAADVIPTLARLARYVWAK